MHRLDDLELNGGVYPKDMTHHFSRSSKKRAPNVMKEYYRYLSIPGMGSFAGGSPSPAYFPFTHLEMTTVSPRSLLQGRGKTNGHSDPDANLRVARFSDEIDPYRKIDINTALQYGIAQGFPPMYAWLRTLANKVYHPGIPYAGKADVVICSGAADALAKIYDVLFNEWDESVNKRRDREGLLVEEMIYPPIVNQVKHKDINIVPVKMDFEGILTDGPGGLYDVLKNWDDADGKRPHALYLIPTGQNPTSGVLSLSRRQEIYEICSHFDVMIIEDDPYWTLTYSHPPARNGNGHAVASLGVDSPSSTPQFPSTGHKFLDELIPSFLSLDRDGRVIRIDTFSKTVAPGCRLGWMTASPRVCEQLIRVTDATTQQPSGLMQAVMAELLCNISPKQTKTIGASLSRGSDAGAHWSMVDWLDWLEGLRDRYQQRMLIMTSILRENRYTISQADKDVEMFSFHQPMGGMFVWVKLHMENHPLISSVTPQRLAHALWVLCAQEPHRIVSVPGKDFAANKDIAESHGYSYLRMCFAAVDESILVSKSHAFVQACRKFWTITSATDVDVILAEEDSRLWQNGKAVDLEEAETERLNC